MPYQPVINYHGVGIYVLVCSREASGFALYRIGGVSTVVQGEVFLIDGEEGIG